MIEDEFWMRLALQQAEMAACEEEIPVGAVAVKDGRVIGRGYNRTEALQDPTAHAEVVAIREACKVLQSWQLTGCELYTSCEPCPMCLGAVMWARIDRLYYGASREDAANAGFDDELFYKELALPKEERMLDTHQLLRDAAVSVFDKWVEKSDKIEY